MFLRVLSTMRDNAVRSRAYLRALISDEELQLKRIGTRDKIYVKQSDFTSTVQNLTLCVPVEISLWLMFL